MLSGRGEKEYRKQHKDFNDAIPDNYEPGMTIEEKAAKHPAYSGPMANGMDAANYCRANDCHGPKSKAEHRQFPLMHKLLEQYERENHVSSYIDNPRFLDWLKRKQLPKMQGLREEYERQVEHVNAADRISFVEWLLAHR